MQTLRVGQGYTKSWTVTLRYAREHPSAGQPVAGVYSGSEAVALVVETAVGAAVSLSASSAVWLSAAAGTITLTLDNSDTDAMAPGRYFVSVSVTSGGEPVEAYRANLVVERRP